MYIPQIFQIQVAWHTKHAFNIERLNIVCAYSHMLLWQWGLVNTKGKQPYEIKYSKKQICLDANDLIIDCRCWCHACLSRHLDWRSFLGSDGLHKFVPPCSAASMSFRNFSFSIEHLPSCSVQCCSTNFHSKNSTACTNYNIGYLVEKGLR